MGRDDIKAPANCSGPVIYILNCLVELYGPKLAIIEGWGDVNVSIELNDRKVLMGFSNSLECDGVDCWSYPALELVSLHNFIDHKKALAILKKTVVQLSRVNQ
jgi:hypothetical protein